MHYHILLHNPWVWQDRSPHIFRLSSSNLHRPIVAAIFWFDYWIKIGLLIEQLWIDSEASSYISNKHRLASLLILLSFCRWYLIGFAYKLDLVWTDYFVKLNFFKLRDKNRWHFIYFLKLRKAWKIELMQKMVFKSVFFSHTAFGYPLDGCFLCFLTDEISWSSFIYKYSLK